MNGRELVKKLCWSECDFADDGAVNVARGAFLAILTVSLKMPITLDFPDGTMREKMLFFAGMVAGHQGEISEEAIRIAHLAMVLPSNRTIISRILYGEGTVNNLGVPASYHS